LFRPEIGSWRLTAFEAWSIVVRNTRRLGLSEISIAAFVLLAFIRQSLEDSSLAPTPEYQPDLRAAIVDCLNNISVNDTQFWKYGRKATDLRAIFQGAAQGSATLSAPEERDSHA
jgi:hypothetical protein